MKLMTSIPFKPKEHGQITHHSQITGIGSCFIENIGSKLEYYKFRAFLNPFGILFNPIVIENLISRAISNDLYVETEVFQNDEHFSCFDAHSSLNSTSSIGLIENLNSSLKSLAASLKVSSTLIITLGSAWVYENVATNKTVANCHKVPQREFSKRILNLDQIKNSLENIVSLIVAANPDIQIIFTVSPVRHIKDGIVENSRSKAQLISATQMICSENKNCHYFPSYEIMIDELRDYRFYETDMLHPSKLAIDYIWERFKTVWISEKSFSIMEKVDTIQKAKSHIPFNKNSTKHQAFLQKGRSLEQQLTSEFPHIKF